MSNILDVYFHDLLAGKLFQQKSGTLSFLYDAKYIHTNNVPAISLSMPLQEVAYEGDKVKAYFSGLLPENQARQRIARFLGISEKNAFALLEIIGGECAGALSLYPKGVIPPHEKQSDVEVLDNQKLHEILDLLKRRPLLAGTDNLRLSLAGAQDKIAIGMQKGKIALVTGATPTTHILKPVIDHVKDSVHNEIFCMHLAQSMGIDAPKSEIYWLDDVPYFLIERYDRVKDKNNEIKRLHQEDFCQAMGVMPELKYENEGGPTIAQSLALLQQHSMNPAADQIKFVQRLIFNYLIGNADAHAKNYSLLYENNMPLLAPAYDLLCTAVYPDISTKMAMRIGRKYDPNYVFLRHWHQIVPDTVAAKKNLEKDLMRMSVESLQKALELKESMEANGVNSPIFGNICEIIKKRAKRIQTELE